MAGIAGGGPPGAGAELAVAARLISRRRAWGWTAGCALAVFGAFAVAYVRDDGTLDPLWPVLAFLALPGVLGVVALTQVIVVSRRLRRVPGELRRPAAEPAAEVGTARAARPTGRVLSAVMVTVIGAVVVIGAPGAVVVLLPAEVNAVAYVTGSGPSATFVPQSSYRNCGGRGGCKTITQGVIERADGTRVNAEWDGEVPLGRPFSVRQPVWTWGPGSTLLHGLRDAIVVLVVGPVVDLGAFLLLFAGCRLARNGLIRRRLRRQAYRERGQAQPASVP